MTPKKRVFILESEMFIDCMLESIDKIVDPNLAEVTLESFLEDRYNIPKGYDVYLIHTSLASPSALISLVNESPENTAIMFRDSIRQDDNSTIRNIERYGTSRTFGHKEFLKALNKYGVLKK